MKEFSVDEFKEAIFIRKRAKYYRDHKPDLKSKPSSFFFYPETIAKDLTRKPLGIYTYDELVYKATADGFDMAPYQKIPGLYNQNNKELWGKEPDLIEFTGGLEKDLRVSAEK